MNILLIAYRRPEPTKRVMDAIARVRPQRLFIATDGPANAAERPACEAVRKILKQVDWSAEVAYDLSERNMGLTARVTTALDWVFGACDRAIVLEDDCLPSERFFGFCDTLLERFALDDRVMHISGESYQSVRRSDRSYLFSKYPLVWGWATWKRAWERFDLELRTWPAFRSQPESRGLFDSDDEREYWFDVFEQMHQRRMTPVWDYAWMYACMTQALSIHPAVNLVSNIGFGSGATHTLGGGSLANRPIGQLEAELRHPIGVVRDREADLATFDDRFPGGVLKQQRMLRHQAGRPFRWLGRRLRGG